MDDISVYLGSTNLLGITNNTLSSSQSTLLDESEEKRTAENSAAPDGIFTVTYLDETCTGCLRSIYIRQNAYITDRCSVLIAHKAVSLENYDSDKFSYLS